MRKDNILAYRATNGKETFIGNASEICKLTGVPNCNLSGYCNCKRHLSNDWTITKIGLYMRIYKVIDKNNEIVFEGFREEVAKYLDIADYSVIKAANRPRYVRWKYLIKSGDMKLVEMEGL